MKQFTPFLSCHQIAMVAALFMIETVALAALDSSFVAPSNNSVASIATQSDGKVLMGGAFTSVSSVPRSYLARLHADGTVDAAFAPNLDRDVAAVAVQPDGKVLVGGYFSNIAGAARSRLARLNADGTQDGSFADAGIVGVAVYGLQLQPDGKILLIGDFSQVGGAVRTHVARLNSDGSLDSGFAPTVNSRVYGITRLSTGQILISGAFTEVSGSPRQRIARLNADGTLDTSFNPAANADVLSMVEQADGRVIMTGNFTTVNGVIRNRIARLLPDGTLDPAYDPNINVQGLSMALQTDGRLMLGGWFTTVGGVGSAYLVRLNPDGSRDTTFTAYANNGVFAAASQADGRLLLGGLFTTVNSTSAPRIARLLNEPATQTMTVPSPARVEWLRGGTAPETSRVTFELSTNGGGSYTTLGVGARIGGGWELTGLALPASGQIRARAFPTSSYFNGSSGLVEQVMTYSFGPEIVVEQPTGTALVDGSSVVDCGSSIQGQSAPTLQFTIRNTGNAVLNLGSITKDGANAAEFTHFGLGSTVLSPGASTTFSVLFTPGGLGTRTAVLHIPSNDSDESPFDISLNGTGMPSSNANLASLGLSAGALVPEFSPTVTTYSASVSYNHASLDVTAYFAGGGASALVNGTVLPPASPTVPVSLNVGGNTITIQVTAQDGVSTKTYTVNVTRRPQGTDGDIDAGFDPMLNDVVLAAATLPDNQMLIGGAFTTVGGVERPYLARLTVSGTLDLPFNPQIGGGHVEVIVVQRDGKILVGGWFDTVAGVPRAKIARLNPDGTLDNTFVTNVDGGVETITLQRDGKILIGGWFNNIGGVARSSVARLNPDGSLDHTFEMTPGMVLTDWSATNDKIRNVTVLPDGKILVGGAFDLWDSPMQYVRLGQRLIRLYPNGTLDDSFEYMADSPMRVFYVVIPQPNGTILVGGRPGLKRLLANGTEDLSFTSAVSELIFSLSQQTDGRMIIGGGFTTVEGRNYLARVNPDGSLDTIFHPVPSDTVLSVMHQKDGGIVVGGYFGGMQDTLRSNIARIHNTPAYQTLTVANPNRVEWLRAGSAPETSRVIFELSTNGGSSYAMLGEGTRISGGWEITGLTLPNTGQVRATAFIASGAFNSSSGLVEQVMTYDLGGVPGATDYQKLAQAMDGGGSRGGSANYTHDGSAGGWAGLSTVASPSETARHGYVGQLYDVTGLQLSATPATVNESATRQLTAAQVMDDATTLPVLASSITWSVQSGPLTGIDANGLATAGAVYQDTLATAQGAYAGTTGSLGLTVLDTIPDNFGTYAADGIGDDWQYQYFGAGNPNAGPSFDPDFDGHDNLFEFTAGLDPLSSTSRFLMTNGRPADQPGRMNITIYPRLNDRTYTVKSSLTLGPGSTWAPLTSFTVSDDGLTRTITDTNAVEGAKFYKVEITKP